MCGSCELQKGRGAKHTLATMITMPWIQQSWELETQLEKSGDIRGKSTIAKAKKTTLALVPLEAENRK